MKTADVEAAIDRASNGSEGVGGGLGSRPASVLPELLLQTSQDISAVLNTLYRSRALLERAAVPRIQHTQRNLARVSDATETAAKALLDGIGRSLALIDQLAHELVPDGHETTAGRGIRQQLEVEVQGLIAAIQFQDLVAQQIAYATQILHETEERMTEAAAHFDSALFGAPGNPSDIEVAEPELDAGFAFELDPDSQAMADSIFDAAPMPPAAGR
jgi:hypothetical protein